MSEHPPPGPPPGWAPYPQQPPPSGMSNTAKFWIGAVCALPAVVVGSVVVGAAGALGAAVDPDTGTATSILVSLAGLLELVALVVGIVWAKTRWYALGLVAGLAVLAVLAAGACVVLIVALTNSYG